jgi:hypothetical protein
MLCSLFHEIRLSISDDSVSKKRQYIHLWSGPAWVFPIRTGCVTIVSFTAWESGTITCIGLLLRSKPMHVTEDVTTDLHEKCTYIGTPTSYFILRK